MGRIHPFRMLRIIPPIVHEIVRTLVPCSSGTHIRMEGEDFLLYPREKEVDNIERYVCTRFVHVSVQKSIYTNLTAFTSYGVHIIHILYADTPHRREVILHRQTGRRNSHRMLHLTGEVAVKRTESDMRNDRPVCNFRLDTLLILRDLIRVNTLDLHGVLCLLHFLRRFLRHNHTGKAKRQKYK